MFEISAKNGFCDVILGSEEKLRIWQHIFHAILALQIPIQRFNEHSRMAKLSQPYLRGTCDETSQAYTSYVNPRRHRGGLDATPPRVFRE